MRLTYVENERRPLWESVPLSPFVFSLAAGIAAAWLCDGGVTLWLCVAAMAVGAAGVALSLPFAAHRPVPALVSACLFFFSVGAALEGEAYRKRLVRWPTEGQCWQARVWSVNKVYAAGVQTDVELLTPPYNGLRVRVSLGGDMSREVRAGDIVRFKGNIRPPANTGNPGDFDYRSYLLSHGIAGTAYLDDGKWEKGANCGNSAAGGAYGRVPLSLRLLMLRDRMLADYARFFDEDDAVIVSALTLGDRSRLTADTRALFSETGTSHILALSGLHLGIVFSLIQAFARRWTHKPRVLAALSLLTAGGLWFFVLLAGSPLSLCRAAWMLTLSQFCACTGRGSRPLNNLFLAAFILLLADPLSLLDVGFQLSFVSVFSIIAGYYGFWRQFRLPRWRRGELAMTLWLRTRAVGKKRTAKSKFFRRPDWTSWSERPYNVLRGVLFPFFTTCVSAQVGTAPLVLYYFHTFAPYSLLANCVVIPLAYVLLGGSLCFFLLPGLRTVVAWVMHTALLLMRGGLETLSALPGAGTKFYPGGLTLAAGALCIFLLLSYRWRRRSGTLLAAAFCVLVCVGVESWRARPGRVRPCIIIYNVPRVGVVHFVAADSVSYLCSTLPADSTRTRLAYVESSFWAPQRMASPSILPENFRDARIYRVGGLMSFGGTRVAALRHTLPRSAFAGGRLSVDILVVGRGCASPLGEILRVYLPIRVVADSSLGYGRAARLREECALADVPFHDVRTDGAFVLPLDDGDKRR